jgi:hypothetical protein
VTHAHYGQDDKHKAYATVHWLLDQALNAEQHAALQRQDLIDADMGITLTTGEEGAALNVRAKLSDPDAAGDGTVPAEASARRVREAGGMCVSGTGYGHDASYGTDSHSEGPKAALHAVLHILKTTGAAA